VSLLTSTETASTQLQAASPEREQKVISTLSLLYVLLACSLSVSAALPEVRRTIAMSDVVTSLHSSFFGWSLLIGGLACNRLFARLGHRNVLAVSVLAMTCGAVFFGFGISAWMTLLGAASFGFGAAVVVITMPAVVANEFGERRNEVFTRINAAPVAGGSFFTLTLAIANSHGLWRLPVIVFPLAFGIAVVVVGRALRPRPISVSSSDPTFLRDDLVSSSQTPARGSLVSLLRDNAGFRRRWLMLVVSVCGEFGFGAWMVTFAREHGKFSAGLAPLMGVMWGGGMIVSRTRSQTMIRLFGDHLETALFLLSGLGFTLAISVPSVPGRMAAVVLSGFAVGLQYPLGVDRLFVQVPGVEVSSISSVGALASGVGITIGPLLVGTISDQVGLYRALFVPVVIALIGAVLSYRRWGNEGGALGRVDRTFLTSR
jgi:MFS family permease